MAFSDIPIRSNGQKIDSSWFNSIRTQLVALLDSLNPVQTSFTIANNQSSYANITSLVLDKDEKLSYVIQYRIYRKDATPTERCEIGKIYANYKPVAATWAFERVTESGDDALNVADSLYVDPATGQVQYKSDNMSGGTYVGTMLFKILTTFEV